jgi:hypothetical protein
MPEGEMTKYVVCKHRNVAAAYERFFGPSSGALPESWHSRTLAGLIRAFRRPRPRAQPVELAQPVESPQPISQS